MVTENPCLVSQYANTGPATPAPETRIRRALLSSETVMCALSPPRCAAGLDKCATARRNAQGRPGFRGVVVRNEERPAIG